MKKLLAFILFFLGTFVFRLPSVLAVDFEVDYKVTYSVAADARTFVSQIVTITNKTSQAYAREYGITIDSQSIRNITAQDSVGVLRTNTVTQDGKTRILVDLARPGIGLNKQTSFTLRYEDPDIAVQQGNMYDIQLPGISPDPTIDQYTVDIEVPESFGPVAYQTPLPQTDGTWTKEQLVQGGVNVVYGTGQLYTVSLSYFLDNPTGNTVEKTITIPPQTPYQSVVIESIVPQPEAIHSDQDGNWLATYKLNPRSVIEVVIQLGIQTKLQPSQHRQELPSELRSLYTRPTTYWQSDTDQIQQLAAAHSTPRAIYDYVVQTLSYNYDRVNDTVTRQGATAALNTPTDAVCMEFTDLFIAIARAAGIPARQAVGYAYTNNPVLRPLSLVSDVLHAWPEYYDDQAQRWIPVDPTWGDTTGGIDYFTKLDFNHITFAYNGISDSEPYPAGFYRQEGKVGKDVSVTIREDELMVPTPAVDLRIEPSRAVVDGIPSSLLITVQNPTHSAVENIDLQLSASKLTSVTTYHIASIPPLGSTTVRIPIQSRLGIFNVLPYAITVTALDASASYIVTIYPFLAAIIVTLVLFVTMTVLVLYLRHRQYRKYYK